MIHLRRVTTILSLGVLSLGLATVMPPQASADDPVLIVSVSGVDEILGDVGYIMEVTGSGALGQMAGMMANQYVQGLDRSKPLGAVVTTDGEDIRPLGLIPVKDLDQFLAGLVEQIGEPQDAGNGVKELGTPTPVYVKEKDGWAFIGQTAQSLADLPENPIALFDGLHKKYDIAIRGIVKNIPEKYRKIAIEQIKDGIDQQLDRQADKATVDELEMQRNLVAGQVEQWERMLNETDRMTVGINTDSKAETMHLDIVTLAIPGSSLAEQMELAHNATSDFTGFVQDKAAVTMSLVGQMTKADISRTLESLEPVRERALKEIDEDNSLESDDARRAAKRLVMKLFVVVEETIKSGKIDGGVSMVLEDATMTVVGGLKVADGNKLDAAIKDLVDIAKQDPEFPGIKFNADSVGDTRIHTMRLPVPEKEGRDVFGENLDVAVGVGRSAVYIGFGKDCVAKLKDAISNSPQDAGPVQPLRMKASLGKIMRFAANFEDNPMVAMLSEAMAAQQGTDNVTVTGKSIPSGVSYRFEIESGVLKSISEVQGAGQAAGAF